MSARTRRRVFAAYGIRRAMRHRFELDHLVPLSLGGANWASNLWPEPRDVRPWGAEAKDRLEDRLHVLVCRGRISLPDAQRAIRTDWIAAYRRFVRHRRL